MSRLQINEMVNRFPIRWLVIAWLLGSVLCIKVEVAEKRNDSDQDSYLSALQQNHQEDVSQR